VFAHFGWGGRGCLSVCLMHSFLHFSGSPSSRHLDSCSSMDGDEIMWACANLAVPWTCRSAHFGGLGASTACGRPSVVSPTGAPIAFCGSRVAGMKLSCAHTYTHTVWSYIECIGQHLFCSVWLGVTECCACFRHCGHWLNTSAGLCICSYVCGPVCVCVSVLAMQTWDHSEQSLCFSQRKETADNAEDDVIC